MRALLIIAYIIAFFLMYLSGEKMMKANFKITEHARMKQEFRRLVKRINNQVEKCDLETACLDWLTQQELNQWKGI